jgi:polysaccharide chain length determinant protein (PEP-CTERM system associated)
MIGQREMKIEDYWQILRRRLWIILVPAILGPIVAVVVTFFLHPEYKSTTLVLVEDQKVSSEYVKPVVTDDLSVRLSQLQEQIMSRSKLQPLIEKFGLFKGEQGKAASEDMVERLGKAIKVTPVTAMAATRPGGLPGFNISVTLDDPRVAQQVCAEVTSMFISEDAAATTGNMVGTTDFITSQLNDAQRDLNTKDAALAAFKAKHIGQLPTDVQQNLSVLNSMNTSLDGANQALSRAQSEKTLLNSMLTQALASAQDVQQKGGDPDLLQKQLQDLQTQLAVAQSRYTDDHPDVKNLKGRIADLQKKIDSQGEAPVEKSEAKTEKTDKADKTEKAVAAEKSTKPQLNESPQIQGLRQQIFLTEQTIKEKTKEQERLGQQIRVYESRIQLTPEVEQQYKELTRDYDIAMTHYQELLKSKNNAEMSKALVMRQQGETFKIMDAANLPEKPSFPNRPIFAGGGLAAGLVLGLGITMLLEFSDKAIRTDRDVESLLGLRTLAMVPVIGEEGRTGAGSAKTVKVKKRTKPQQQPVGA